MAVVMICFPLRFPCSTAARMAQLSPSVPQEVKVNSSGRQPSLPATTARYSFTLAAAAWPMA